MMKIETSTPVVVLACPHHAGLGVTRSLGRLGVPVFNVDVARWPPVRFSKYCRGKFVWDLDGHPVTRSVAKLVEIARKVGRRSLLIPGTDRAAVLVADQMAALKPWYIFPTQDRTLVRSLCSKRQMSDLARQHEVPSPVSLSLETQAERMESLRKVNLPVIVKGADEPVRNRCGRAKVVIRTQQQFSRFLEAMGEETVPELIAQEYIPGGEGIVWIFNGYFNERSECLAGFTGRKLRQCPAYTGVASLGICHKNDAIESAATKLLKAIGYQGIVDMDFCYDARDGQYKLLDVNPRLGSTFRLFVSANGMDVARACYLDLTKQAVTVDAPADGRKWIVEDFDLVASLRYALDGKLGLREWLKSLRGIREPAFMALDDLRPVLLMLRTDAVELARRLSPRQRPWLSGVGKRPDTSKLI